MLRIPERKRIQVLAVQVTGVTWLPGISVHRGPTHGAPAAGHVHASLCPLRAKRGLHSLFPELVIPHEEGGQVATAAGLAFQRGSRDLWLSTSLRAAPLGACQICGKIRPKQSSTCWASWTDPLAPEATLSSMRLTATVQR